ncbi:MAG: hypothetical protein Kow0062_21470 [Acidobacteriota bacterium]
MKAAWTTYLDRLGPQGLRVVLERMIEPSELESLVGRRMETGEGPADPALFVVDAVAERPDLGGTLLERLDELADGRGALPEGEGPLRQLIADQLRAPDDASAALLHRLARADEAPLPVAELRTAAELIAAALEADGRPARREFVAKVASDRASLKELEQERRELEARVRKLETQLARAVERTAALEERLARRLNELHAARQSERSEREERTRLAREVERLRRRIEQLNERRAQERTGEVSTALRRLTREHRRAAAALEKLREAERERREVVRENSRQVVRLAGLVEQLVALREAESRQVAAAQQEILRQFGDLRRELVGDGEGERPAARTRRRAGEVQRVGLFVDVQNMFYGARERGARVDFEALLAAASEGRQLVRAVAYVVEAKEIDQSAFIHLLQMKAYEVKRKPLRVRADRTAKGNWDLEMALDAMSSADNLDVVVLATGDGDFVPLVRQLKMRGVRVEVYGFRRSTAPDLREAADRFVAIGRKLLRDAGPRKTASR